MKFYPSLLLSLISVLCGLLFLGESAKLTLNIEDIEDEETLQHFMSYGLLSYLDTLATDIFRLRLSPRAKENAFKELDISDESLFLLKSVTQKELKIPIELKPTDEHINDTLEFLDAFKNYWKQVDVVATMEVSEMDPLKFPSNIKENIENRISKSFERKGKSIMRRMTLSEGASKEHLRMLLEDILIEPRNSDSESGKLEKQSIQSYIANRFEKFGLSVMEHDFSSHETEFTRGHQIVGTNVIGILHGTRWGTEHDVPVIIGAHYDTVPDTPGTIDNASGTSAVIEAARMLTSSDCKFKNSIIFVVFDLEEIGLHGSFMFVKDILLRLIMPTYGISTIGGAIIMDCVANWDPEDNSQEFPETWQEKVEGLKEMKINSNNTGDFLAIIHRKIPDKKLAERLEHYYTNLDEAKFRIQLMPLKELRSVRPNDTVNIENFDFFRSDHYRFWYPLKNMPDISFPAVLLTDTGPYRGKMKKCYHQPCDNLTKIEPNIVFLSKITTTAAWTAADLASATCDKMEVNQLFQKRINKTKKIPLSNVIEVLKYLGRSNYLQNLQKSQIDVERSSLPNVIRTNVQQLNIGPERSKIINTIPTGLTITVYGKNSTYLIPIKIQVPSTNKLNSISIDSSKSNIDLETVDKEESKFTDNSSETDHDIDSPINDNLRNIPPNIKSLHSSIRTSLKVH